MAVTKAKSEKDVKEDAESIASGEGLEDVSRGASGGAAPEGYGAPGLVGGGSGGVENAVVANEGVATRTPEQEAAREKAAEEFKESVRHAGEASPEQVAKEQKKVEKKRSEKADDKPTAAGVNISALDAPNASSAKETVKAEHEVVKDESAKADEKKDVKKTDKK